MKKIKSKNYATIKFIPNIDSMSAKEIFDYISKHSEWKTSKDSPLSYMKYNSAEDFISFLDDNDNVVLFDLYYNRKDKRYVARLFEPQEDITELRNELLLAKLKKEYLQQDDVCMGEFLKTRKVTCDIESAFNLYACLMEWAENDSFFRMNKEEEWVENCTENGMGRLYPSFIINILSQIHNSI